MAGKLTALGSNCYVGVYDLSGDIGAVKNMEAMLATINVTALNKSAPELLPGRRDGAMGFLSFFNIDAGQEQAVFSAAPRTDAQSTVVIGTPALGSPAASMIAKQMNYAGTLGEDGSLGFDVDMVGSGYGLEWGELLTTGKQSFGTGTVDGTAIDLGAVSSLFGAAGYLHVFSVASGTAVFAVQDSDDNLTFADVAGLVFTGATGATTQRLQTAAGATIRQYVRVEGRGTHGAAVVAVNFVRYTEAGPV
jgi:hypothetical protein